MTSITQKSKNVRKRTTMTYAESFPEMLEEIRREIMEATK